MINVINKYRCCGCSACLSACPRNCISMKEDSEGFLYPAVDTNKCINCGLCEKVCVYNKEEPKRLNSPLTFAAKNIDNAIREKSSSGGLFSLFANFILDKQGVVYGVSMDDDCKSCSFARIDNKDDLYKLYGSKYFQAKTGNIYKQIKDDLDIGKDVLFSGVPCQIDALKPYLSKDYDNLLTVEVICHGVPSPALWKKYTNHLEEKYNATIEHVSFRSKMHGWHKFGLIEEGNNITQYLSLREDPFMIMFLRNYCLRPSCYNCQAKKLESMADLTIGDFWGIETVLPEMDDDMGTSILLVQTDKGKKLVDLTNDKLIIKEVPFLDSINHNRVYSVSCSVPKERNSFFYDMNSLSFEELQAKYCKARKTNIVRRALRFVKRIIKRGGGK